IHGSVGVGLSLNTPVGPLRLDYGRGDQGGRVHFTVGGTF
ncbi:MAG: BamA/TamA family outer membrane protein, partial [Selenomonas sp.]|nr:BamA/TamA family outer membrane protein [Selenomonas sp.]